MSFRDTKLYSSDTLIIEEICDDLFSNEKIKHLVGSKANKEGLIVYGGYERGSLKSNSCNKVCLYCKKKGPLRRIATSCKIERKKKCECN